MQICNQISRTQVFQKLPSLTQTMMRRRQEFAAECKWENSAGKINNRAADERTSGMYSSTTSRAAVENAKLHSPSENDAWKYSERVSSGTGRVQIAYLSAVLTTISVVSHWDSFCRKYNTCRVSGSTTLNTAELHPKYPQCSSHRWRGGLKNSAVCFYQPGATEVEKRRMKRLTSFSSVFKCFYF